MVPRGPLFLLALALSTVVGFSACKFEPSPKAYAQITLRHAETRIQLLTLMEISSTDECESALRSFMDGFMAEGGAEGWSESERSCHQTLDPMYQNVMNRGTFHATYLAFSPRNAFEYEGRIVLFGIPSSQAQEICHKIAQDVGGRLGVEAECVQGTVG